MNRIPVPTNNKTSIIVLLCLLAGWILPAHAGRHYNDRQQLVERSADQYQGVDNRRYADASSADGRRYPARGHTDGKAVSKEPSYSSKSRSRRHQNTSLNDAISRVRRKSKGRVLSAETVRNNNREEHRVRVITDDGRVRRYRLDAETGDLLPRRR